MYSFYCTMIEVSVSWVILSLLYHLSVQKGLIKLVIIETHLH